MVEKGIIQAIGSVFDTQEPRFLIVALEGINFVMKMGKEHLSKEGVNPFVEVVERSGLLDKLEQLQFSKNQKVYEKSMAMLEEYFNVEDDEADIMDMLNNGNTQQTMDSNSLFNNNSESSQQLYQF